MEALVLVAVVVVWWVWRGWRRLVVLEEERRIRRAEGFCDVEGCNRTAVWRISKRKTVLEVCSSCRDELVGAHGFRFDGRDG